MKPVSSTEVAVSTAGSPDSPGAIVYEAAVGLISCDAPATGGAPFTCTIGTLLGGTLYTVQVVACLSTGDCSSTTSGEGYTLPDSTSTCSSPRASALLEQGRRKGIAHI